MSHPSASCKPLAITQHKSFKAQEKLIDSRITYLEQKLISSKRERNALQPISRLPVEILLRIFALLAGLGRQLKKEDLCWNWLILTKICHHWRSAALGFPKLWSEIKQFYRVDKIQTFLDRSQNSDLIVTLSHEINSAEIPARDYLSILDIIFDHIGRVRDLTVYAYSNDEVWERLTDLLNEREHARRLKKLHLIAMKMPSSLLYLFRRPEEHLNHLNHLTIDTPNHGLDDVSVKGLRVSWNNPIFYGLSKLTIDLTSFTSEEDFSTQLTLADFSNICAACPNLRNLTLIDAGPTSTPELPSSQIYLGQLEVMNISGIYYDECVELFNYLIVPKDVQWFIACELYPFHNPSPFLPGLWNYDKPSECIAIHLGDEFISFQSEDINGDVDSSSAVLELKWSPEFNPPLLQSKFVTVFSAISSILNQSIWRDATTLAFYVDFEREASAAAFRKTAWIQLLSLYPTIKSLAIVFPSKFIPNKKSDLEMGLEWGFTETIARRINSNQETTIMCPELKNITLTNARLSEQGKRPYEIFVQHLRYRRQLGKRLNRIWFNHCEGLDEGDIEALKALGIAEEVRY